MNPIIDNYKLITTIRRTTKSANTNTRVNTIFYTTIQSAGDDFSIRLLHSDYFFIESYSYFMKTTKWFHEHSGPLSSYTLLFFLIHNYYNYFIIIYNATITICFPLVSIASFDSIRNEFTLFYWFTHFLSILFNFILILLLTNILFFF